MQCMCTVNDQGTVTSLCVAHELILRERVERATETLQREHEILLWYAHESALRAMGSEERGWSLMDCSDGLVVLSRGKKTLLEAIEAGMKKFKSKLEKY